MEGIKRLAAAGVVTVLLLTACGTGVQDEKGWNKALTRNYPCSELVEIAENLPASANPEKVAQDLRQRSCEPPADRGSGR